MDDRLRNRLGSARPSAYTAAKWGPGALLTAVALVQLVMVCRADLTPWEGGGFGMFSTLDYGTNRRFLVEGLDQRSQSVQVNLFAGDQSLHARLRIMPDRGGIERLAQRILDSELVPDRQEQVKMRLAMASAWRLERAFDKRPAPPKIVRMRSPADVETAPGKLVRLKAVRISLWRKRFDALRSRLYWERIGEPVLKGDWP